MSGEIGALREELQPTIDWLVQQDGARKLCRALALAEGFHFQLAICNTPRLSAALQVWLGDAVAAERGASVEIERVSPYPLDWRAAGPVDLDEAKLGELVLDGLIGVPAGRLVFIDAARAGTRDRDAWATVLMRLNERRNGIARQLGSPLTLILRPSFEAEFARLAPDLWSIRSVVVELRDRDEPTRLLSASTSDAAIIEDVTALEYEIEHLRERASAGSRAAIESLLVLLGRLARAKEMAGDVVRARQLFLEGEALAEHLGDRQWRAIYQLRLSDLAELRGDYQSALRLIDQATLEFLELGDEWAVASAQGRRADILRERGELDEALRIRREQQLPIYERLGDMRERAVTIGKVADILTARGELEEALRIRREEQLPVYERLGDAGERAVTMGRIADILRARGELDEALRILGEEVLPVYERLGDVRSRAAARGRVADILWARGELDEAVRILREEALPVYEQLGDVRSVLITQANLAWALAQRPMSIETRREVDALLTAAMRDARRLRLPEVQQIADIMRGLGLDPDAT